MKKTDFTGMPPHIIEWDRHRQEERNEYGIPLELPLPMPLKPDEPHFDM